MQETFHQCHSILKKKYTIGYISVLTYIDHENIYVFIGLKKLCIIKFVLFGYS